ncbi:MAG: MarR family winged helix-turn-helix transcriptional regulator [Candidatus Pacebacteria bacterium]|nr:MarR family winged helix-turn-helix transcriptional regulator [Candidatus Paceibacterota bacterium]MDD5357020.1 MarR family winged helix-turn-helix transcriptional regulator [Candidatus Paceibacterota bacterium]
MKQKVPIEIVLRPTFRFAFTMARLSGRILRNEIGIGISQFRMLAALSNLPNSSQKKIASFWDVTEASISRQIQNLLAKDLIVKTKNPENIRSPFLNVSEKGKKLLKKSLHHIDRHAETTFNTITPEERKTLSRLLEKMFVCAKKEVEI